MLQALSDRILSDWGRLMPAVPRPSRLRYLGISGSVEGGTTTFLAFGPKQSAPLLAVKVHRDPDAGDRVASERAVLDAIGAAGGVPAGSVPRVFFCGDIEGHWLIVESILSGRPMRAVLTREGTPELTLAARNLDQAAAWLLELGRRTRDLEQPRSSAVQEGLRDIEAFTSTFDLSLDERTFLKAIAAELEAPGIGSEGVQHGDFCRQNILVDSGTVPPRLGVVDWTDSKRYGLPLHDILFFVTTYGLQARRRVGINGFVRLFEETFFESNAYSRIVEACLARYCEAASVPREHLDTWLGMFLVRQAMFEYRKMQRFARNGGLPRFTLYLAAVNERGYDDALKEQLWIYFFRALVRRRRTLFRSHP